MPLQPLKIKPGLNRENTRYTQEGSWWLMNRVRFRSGTAESIGGWQPLSTATFKGCCRFLWNWITLGSENLLALATNLKLYVERGGQFYDLTPIRLVTGALNNIFTTNATTTVTVAITAHGAYPGDFVTFSGVVNFDGITFNQQYEIVSTPTVNSFTITTTLASGSHTAGGAACVATFQINTGPVQATYGVGWGVGAWGAGGWGLAASGSGVVTSGMQQWVGTSFGEVMFAAPRFGALYYWWPAWGGPTPPTFGGSISNSLTAYPFRLLSTDVTGGGFSNPPLFAGNIVTTDNQFLIIGGTNPVGSSTFDPMTVRWCDEGNFFQWNPAITNQAGDMKLSSGSYIYAMKKMRQEVVIWTDAAVISMQYVGAPVVFSFTTLSTNSSIVGINAVVIADGVAYWMANEKFYKYDGHVQTLLCDVRKYVFTGMNIAQISQTYAGANEEFNEVTWFYCSTNATTPDLYVTYNYLEGLWTVGSMERTAWLSSSMRPDPIGASYADGKLYYHETGVDDGSVTPNASINSYIESAGSDISDGNAFSFVSRIIPDVDFTGSTAATPTVTLTLKAVDTPGNNFLQTNPRAVTQTSVVPFSQFTPMCYTRIRGRQIVYRLDCTTPGVAWQMGTPRLETREDGSR